MKLLNRALAWLLNPYASLNPKVSEESRLITAFLDNPQANWEALRNYFEKSEEFFKSRLGYQFSPSGRVRIETDMYTYVYIGGHDSSLDTRPGEYGLLRWQADQLFTAILSCAPGCVGFEEKLKAKMEREGYSTESKE